MRAAALPPEGTYVFRIERDVPGLEIGGRRESSTVLTISHQSAGVARFAWASEGEERAETFSYDADAVRLTRTEGDLFPCRLSRPLETLRLPPRQGARWESKGVCLESNVVIEERREIKGWERVLAAGETVEAVRVDTFKTTRRPDGSVHEGEYRYWYDKSMLLVRRVYITDRKPAQTHTWTLVGRQPAE